jgi:ABC-type nitrate/sulfonate/bicarbonate transport system substrate-binding protein
MVVVTYRQKLKVNPSEVMAFLRALRNAMSVIQTSKDKVIAAAVKKDPNANVNVLRKSLDYTLDSFSIALGKKNIQALISAAKINVKWDVPGATEKFFVDDFLTKALSAK